MQIAADYSRVDGGKRLPKLFVNAEPGAILIGAAARFLPHLENQTEVTVPGSHFIQEDFRARDRPGDHGMDDREWDLTGDSNSWL